MISLRSSAIYRAKGLAWIKVTETGAFESSIVKFFSEDTLKAVSERMGAQPGDLMVFVADRPRCCRCHLQSSPPPWAETQSN